MQTSLLATTTTFCTLNVLTYCLIRRLNLPRFYGMVGFIYEVLGFPTASRLDVPAPYSYGMLGMAGCTDAGGGSSRCGKQQGQSMLVCTQRSALRQASSQEIQDTKLSVCRNDARALFGTLEVMLHCLGLCGTRFAAAVVG